MVPETVQNFEALLTGENDAGVSYKGTEAYKVLDGLNIQVRWGRVVGHDLNVSCSLRASRPWPKLPAA